MALKKIYRLPNRRLSKTRAYRTRAFLLKISSNEKEISRFGFIIPKSVDKSAVVRNKLRRIFHTHIQGLLKKIRPGFDMLFIVRKEALDIEKDRLVNLIELSFKQPGLFK